MSKNQTEDELLAMLLEDEVRVAEPTMPPPSPSKQMRPHPRTGGTPVVSSEIARNFLNPPKNSIWNDIKDMFKK